MSFFQTKSFALQSFTYFIPAPPNRSTGYREKHFDRLLSDFLAIGFDLVNITTESNANGMWVICILKPLNEKAANTNWDNFQEKHHSSLSMKAKNDSEIDGFYYIKDHSDE